MASLAERIQELKKDRRAVILAHNYQLPEIQDIADIRGDSLQLSREAAKTEADVIVFCGVHFMAETAAMLSPQKTVLLPAKDAGCPMADMITAEQLRELKGRHPGAIVVCYVNSSAEVKAESDYCCTSANAVSVVGSLPAGREIIFVPDQYLGQFAAERTGRDLILWNGYCPTHVRITEEAVSAARAEHPGAKVIVHPECTQPVRQAADEVLSTGGMCRFAAESQATEFIVGTEIGMVHRLAADNPGKQFHPVAKIATCPNMKKITLEKLLWSLDEMVHVITVPPQIRQRALGAIERMVSISG